MFQLVFASAAVRPMTVPDLDALLMKAGPRNEFYKVTGLLVYDKGSFLEVLEGSEEGVRSVFQHILRSSKHKDVRVLVEASIQSREFGSWSMGFIDTTRGSMRPTGHVDYHRCLPALADAGTRAKRYLRFFQEGLYRQGTQG